MQCLMQQNSQMYPYHFQNAMLSLNTYTRLSMKQQSSKPVGEETGCESTTLK